METELFIARRCTSCNASCKHYTCLYYIPRTTSSIADYFVDLVCVVRPAVVEMKLQKASEVCEALTTCPHSFIINGQELYMPQASLRTPPYCRIYCSTVACTRGSTLDNILTVSFCQYFASATHPRKGKTMQDLPTVCR